MSTKYYGNQQCKVITEIENEAVIELLIGEITLGDCGYDETGYVEPYHAKIIVDKRHLSDTPLVSQDIIAEKSRAISEATKEIQGMKQIVCGEIRETRREAEKELKEIKDRVNKLGRHGLVEYLNFLEGKYEYAVIANHYYKIIKLDEMFCDSSSNSNELAAISFRGKACRSHEKNDGSLYLHQYSDTSGSKYKITGFATLGEAQDYLINLIESGSISPQNVTEKGCKKYVITCPKIEEYRAKLVSLNQEKKLKSIANLEKQLEDLKREV